MTIEHAMVLAAGRGERMRPLTDSLPKPLLSVGGRPLIEWHLLALARAGVRHVVINLSWLGHLISAHLGRGERFGLNIEYSDEGPVALETAGGIIQALPRLGGGPFWVVNGDVWSDFNFADLPAPSDADASLVLVPNPPQHPRGDFAMQRGWVTESAASERLTFAGIAVYQPAFFAGCTPGRAPLLPLLRRAIAAQRLRGQRYDGLWFDIGTPRRLQELDARLGASASG
jgi:MurNAc alpha-1-phosphate uridylyltransferase